MVGDVDGAVLGFGDGAPLGNVVGAHEGFIVGVDDGFAVDGLQEGEVVSPIYERSTAQLTLEFQKIVRTPLHIFFTWVRW